MELIDGLEVNPAACETTHPRKYKVYSSSTSLLGFQLLMILTALIGSCTLSMNIFLMRIFHVTNGGIKSVKFSSESGLWFKDDVVFAEMLKTSQLSHISHHRVRYLSLWKAYIIFGPPRLRRSESSHSQDMLTSPTGVSPAWV